MVFRTKLWMRNFIINRSQNINTIQHCQSNPMPDRFWQVVEVQAVKAKWKDVRALNTSSSMVRNWALQLGADGSKIEILVYGLKFLKMESINIEVCTFYLDGRAMEKINKVFLISTLCLNRYCLVLINVDIKAHFILYCIQRPEGRTTQKWSMWRGVGNEKDWGRVFLFILYLFLFLTFSFYMLALSLLK